MPRSFAFDRCLTLCVLALALVPTSSVAAPGVPALYGVYAIQNGRFVEIPEAYFTFPGETAQHADKRFPPDSGLKVPAFLIRDRTKVTLPNGRLSFVLFDPSAAAVGHGTVTIFIVAHVRVGKERDPAGNVIGTYRDPNDLEVVRNEAQGRFPNLWVLRSEGYDFRVGPFGGRSDMILIRSADGNFTLPNGRYRILLLNHFYDFVVGVDRAVGAYHCVDLVQRQVAPYSHEEKHLEFEDCAGPISYHQPAPRPTPYIPAPIPRTTTLRAAPVPRATAGKAASILHATTGNVEGNNWRQLRYPDDGFSVASPVEFNVQVLSRKLGMQHWYTAPLIGQYGVSIDVLDEPEYDDADQILAEARVSMPRTILGGVLRTAKPFDFIGYPGMELVYEGTDRHVRARAFVVGHRLYILHVTSPLGTQPWSDEDRFLTSFRLLPR